jgi:probable HAF family extracellular repeat protein
VRFVATVWDHGTIKNLGTFGGGFSFALGATDQNFVMGYSENGVIDTSGFTGLDGVSEIRAFGWNGRKISDLGTLGGTGAFPSTINNLREVVGSSSTDQVFGTPFRPFLWSAGKIHDLGTLGGHFGGANAINNGGQVVGQTTLIQWTNCVDDRLLPD